MIFFIIAGCYLPCSSLLSLISQIFSTCLCRGCLLWSRPFWKWVKGMLLVHRILVKRFLCLTHYLSGLIHALVWKDIISFFAHHQPHSAGLNVLLDNDAYSILKCRDYGRLYKCIMVSDFYCLHYIFILHPYLCPEVLLPNWVIVGSA